MSAYDPSHRPPGNAVNPPPRKSLRLDSRPAGDRRAFGVAALMKKLSRLLVVSSGKFMSANRLFA
jgi:hypothetical protein